MASLTFSIDTLATGSLALAFDLTEENAQRMLTAIVGSAAPITDVRAVPDPDDPTKTVEESYQRPRKLGEALRDKVNAFVNDLKASTVAYEEAQVRAALVAPTALDLTEQP